MATESLTQRREVGRSWHSKFVLLSCCLPMIHLGYFNSIGTIFTDVMTAFNSTRAETSVLQSTTIAVFLFSGSFTGALVRRIGVRTGGIIGCLMASLALMACFFASSITYLIIFVGVISGTGMSCIYISSAATVSQQFSGKKQLLYMSIHASGIGIGGVIYPYLIRLLCDIYGFRGALLILGAIGLNALPGCILWKHLSDKSMPLERDEFTIQVEEFQTNFQVRTMANGNCITIEKIGKHPCNELSGSVYVSQYPVLQDKTKINNVTVQNADHTSNNPNKRIADQTLFENIKLIIRNKAFVIFTIGQIFVMPYLAMIVIFVADIYKDNGLSNDDVSLGILLINMMAMIGQFLLGVSLQFKSVSTLILSSLNSLVSGIVVLVLSFVKTRWLIIALTGAYGIALGVFTSMFTVVTLKLVGTALLPTAIGIMFTFISIGHVVAAPINGYIRDIAGTYTAVFYIATGINLIGTVVFFGAHVARRKEEQAIKKQSSEFYLTSF